MTGHAKQGSNNNIFPFSDSPIAESTQQMFLDDLLTSYQQIETGFAQQLYQLYKGFEFRSLWIVQEKLAEFERRAVLAAQGTGNLLGVFELTKALQEIDDIENKAQLCFTKFRHAITTNKWTFDSNKDNVVCGAFLLSSLLRELLNKTYVVFRKC